MSSLSFPKLVRWFVSAFMCEHGPMSFDDLVTHAKTIGGHMLKTEAARAAGYCLGQGEELNFEPALVIDQELVVATRGFIREHGPTGFDNVRQHLAVNEVTTNLILGFLLGRGEIIFQGHPAGFIAI